MHRMDFLYGLKIDQMLVEHRSINSSSNPYVLTLIFMKDTFSTRKSKVKCAKCQNIPKKEFSLCHFFFFFLLGSSKIKIPYVTLSLVIRLRGRVLDEGD
jgi:hypothetical protein